MPPGLVREPGTLDSPIASRKAPVERTPSKPLNLISFTTTGITSTPSRKAAPPGPLIEASPNCVLRQERQAPKTAEGSIYSALGWDDEEYEQLA